MKNAIRSFKILMLLNTFNIKSLAFMLINSLWMGILGFLMIGEGIDSEYYNAAAFLISISLTFFIKSFSGYTIQFISSKKFLFSTNINKSSYVLSSIFYNNLLGLIYIIISAILQWCIYSNRFGTVKNCENVILIALIITALVATVDVLFMCSMVGFIIFVIIAIILLSVLKYNYILLNLESNGIPMVLFPLAINLILNISTYLYCSYIYKNNYIIK